MFPHVISDYREADATHLLIDVEGIDIGHAADIVYHGHEARLEVGALDFILAAEAAYDLLGVEAVGVDGGGDQRLHERLHQDVASQLHVQHGLALIDLLVGELRAAVVGLAHRRLHMVQQTALKRAVENLPLVADEGLHALMLQLVDRTGPHVYYLLVLIGDALVGNPLQDLVALAVVEESQQGLAGLVESEDLQLVRVLDIHNLVADVVGGLDEIHQGMAGEAKRLALGREPFDAQLAGDVQIAPQLTMEEAELGVGAGLFRHEGVLHDAGQHGVGHQESSRPSAKKMVGEQAEGVGVALKVGDVAPELRRYFVSQGCALALGEESLYGLFPRMAEGRVAHVVGQTGSGDDGAYLLEERAAQLGVQHHEPSGDVVAQGVSHGGDLQGMGQPVVYEDASRQGKHLCLVLHSPKGGREHQAVVVALEFGPLLMHFRVVAFLPETLV